MRVISLSIAILLCASWASGLTLSSLFGGGESIPEGAPTSVELAPLAVPEVQEHHKPEKPEKPHKPFLPEIFKPLKKPEGHKPLKKPVKKPIKKPHKKPHKKPVKKPVKKPGKPCSIFSHLPSLPSFGKLPNKLTEKLPHKKVIKVTKTEYVEVTKRQTVHPVCYVTLKHKKPCIKEHSNDEDYDETYDQEQNYDLQVQVEEDKGEIVPTATLQVSPTLSFIERHAKQVNSSSDDSSDDEETQDENETEDNDENDVEEEEVTKEGADETQENDRNGRYIKFNEQPISIEMSEEERDYELEPSEDVESRIKKKHEIVTKTILVTRLEKFTDTHVTATVIAKNCAPVTPHVPPCKKKHSAAIIRDRPDDDTPLVILPVSSVVAPPEVHVDGKEIVNDEVEDTEVTVEEPEQAENVSEGESEVEIAVEDTNDQIQTE